MRLARVMSDGSTLRDHLMVEARATGQFGPALTAVVPRAGAALFSAFRQVRARSAGLSSGLTHGELAAWQALHGVRLTAWEIDTMLAMDDACADAAAAQRPHAAAKPRRS